jgi:hypothetical protein
MSLAAMSSCDLAKPSLALLVGRRGVIDPQSVPVSRTTPTATTNSIFRTPRRRGSRRNSWPTRWRR